MVRQARLGAGDREWRPGDRRGSDGTLSYILLSPVITRRELHGERTRQQQPSRAPGARRPRSLGCEDLPRMSGWV